MSDIDDLDEEEINRQLAELGAGSDDEIDSDIDIEELEAQLADSEPDKINVIEPDFHDEEELEKQIEEEIDDLIRTKSGEELITTLRTRLIATYKKNDEIVQRIVGIKSHYEELKKQSAQRKDIRLIKLEEEIASLERQLDEEDNESAHMFTVLRNEEKKLLELQEKLTEESTRQSELRARFNQRIEAIEKSIERSTEQFSTFRLQLHEKQSDLDAQLKAKQGENVSLKQKNYDLEMRVEELLEAQKHNELDLSSTSGNVEQLKRKQQKELEDLEELHNNITAQIDATAVANKARKEQADQLNTEYRAVNRAQTKIKLDHDDAERAIQQMERDVQRNRKQIERLQEEIELLNKERRDLRRGSRVV